VAISVGDIVAVSFLGTINAQRTVTTLHFRAADASGTATSTLMQNLITLIRAGGGGGDTLETTFLNCCAQNFTLNSIRAQKLSTVRAKFESQNRASPGNVAVDCDITNISGVLTKQGALANRRNIGSVHMPAVPNGYASAGDVSGTYLTLLNAMAAKLTDVQTVAADTVNYFPVIFNRTTPADSPFISSAFAQTTMRVMRRRTVGLGI